MTMFVNLNIVSATASHHCDDRAALLADHPERNREEDAEHDDLEHVAFRHRLDDRLGHDVQEDLIPRLRGRGDLRLRAHRQVDADAGLHDVDGDQPDDQRERRHDLEVDDRPQPHAADDLDVSRSGDARDQRREDQRRDDHLDHPQEQLAEGPEIDRRRRVVLADDPAGDDAECEADEDLLGKGDAAARRGFSGRVSHSGLILQAALAGRGHSAILPEVCNVPRKAAGAPLPSPTCPAGPRHTPNSVTNTVNHHTVGA